MNGFGIYKEAKRILLFVILGIFLNITTSYAKEVSFTQEDRDRLIRFEMRLEEGLKAVNQRIDDTNKRIDDINRRIDDTNKRIDDLRDLIYILIGAVIAQTIGVIGFVIWDRRTALQPAIRKTRELEERGEKVERALKELAKKDSHVAEVLKNVGLL